MIRLSSMGQVGMWLLRIVFVAFAAVSFPAVQAMDPDSPPRDEAADEGDVPPPPPDDDDASAEGPLPLTPPEQQRQDAKALWGEGQGLLKQARFKEAAAKFDAAFQLDPEPELLLWQGVALNGQKDYQASKAAFARVLALGHSNQDQRSRAIGYLREILAKVSGADERRRFALGLKDASGVELGKLFADADKLDPSKGYALASAKAFASSGDTTRAAALYRSALADKGLDEGERSLIQLWLLAEGFNESPVYPNLRSVQSSYVDTPAISVRYKEEEDPEVDVWNGQIRPAIAVFLGVSQYHGQVRSGDRKLFRHQVIHPLGTMNDKDLDSLLMQGVAYYVHRAQWSPADVDRVCRSVGIDPAKLPRQWPKVEEIQKQTVTYLQNDAEREPYKLGTRNGMLTNFGNTFDTANMSTMFSGEGWAIYVMSPDGALFAGTHRVSRFHHSSFLAAAEVAGAGEIKVENGRVLGISNKSGHYRPAVIQLVQTLAELDRRGINLDAAEVLVGGQLASGAFKPAKWPMGAKHFIATYRNPDRTEFLRIWKQQLNFQNDPYAG